MKNNILTVIAYCILNACTTMHSSAPQQNKCQASNQVPCLTAAQQGKFSKEVTQSHLYRVTALNQLTETLYIDRSSFERKHYQEYVCVDEVKSETENGQSSAAHYLQKIEGTMCMQKQIPYIAFLFSQTAPSSALSCHLCNIKYGTEKDLRNHIVALKYACLHCKALFCSKADLSDHLKFFCPQEAISQSTFVPSWRLKAPHQ